MKKVTKLIVMGVALIMCLGIFSGCGKVELQLGVYENDNKTASVTLLENNEFEFNRNITDSYRPTGKYRIEKKKLILHAEDEEYIFNVKNGQLFFVSGPGLGTLFESGTVFKLKEKVD